MPVSAEDYQRGLEKSVTEVLGSVGKHVDAHLAEEHGSIIEGLLTQALEKDILLAKCKDFEKLRISPLYNTKLVRDYVASVESSAYSKNLRHYYPLFVPHLRDKIAKPALTVITDWIKTKVMKTNIEGLEQALVNTPLSRKIFEKFLKPTMKDVHDRFQVLNPVLWDGVIPNDEILQKSTEIASEIIYYTSLDEQILNNFENEQRRVGENYAYTVSSFLEKLDNSEMKKRGYFLESEITYILANLPPLLCPTECSQGFFANMLDSCTTKQRDSITKMLEGLPPIQVQDLPQNAVPFNELLVYILAKTEKTQTG